MLCDGSVYTVTAYPTLGALLQNTYGGSTGTFAVPNLKGLFIRGSGSQTIGGTTYVSGSIGTAQIDAFASHTHTIGTGINGLTTGSGLTSPATSGGVSGTQYSGATGTTNPIETRPVNLAMVYCIKI